MKKLIVIGAILALNLSAYEMCGEKISLDRPLNVSKDWVSKNEKAFGVEHTKYTKNIKNESCQVFVDSSSKNVVKLSRTIKSDKPIIPSDKTEGAVFGAGKILYYDSGVKHESIFSDFLKFKEDFEKGKKYLRFAQAEYKGDSLVAINNTMCTTYGNKCSTVIELKSNKMKNSYFEDKQDSLVNQKMNKIVEDQKLKLSNTNGWK